MIFNTFLSCTEEIPLFKRCGIQEVIVEHWTLSRLGLLKTKEFVTLCTQAHAEGLSLLLQWDVLCDDAQLTHAVEVFKTLPLTLFDAIRIQDLGVAEWIQENHPELALHWIVESNSHNLDALQGWQSYFGSQLKRLVLSTEIPCERLKEYCKHLKVPCEILGLGRILIFHTPRALISPCVSSEIQSGKELQVSTAEHPSRNFSALENQHGSFLFHHRNLFLLKALPDYLDSALHTMRLDLRNVNTLEWMERITECCKENEASKLNTLKNDWPVSTTQAFYRANHTDRGFAKLKNKYRESYGEDWVATVVESHKKKYLALISRKPFRCGDSLRFLNPEGKELVSNIRSIRNSSGVEVEEAQESGLWLIPHVKYMCSQSLVYSMSAQ